MLRQFGSPAAKTLSKFTVIKNTDGFIAKFRVVELTKDLVDNFVDFQINHFVKNELMHQISGIPFSVKAIDEYRDILKNTCSNPLYYNAVCFPEVNGVILPKIAATRTLKLINKSGPYYDQFPAITKEVKKLNQIFHDWNNFCPISDLMMKYGVEDVFEYQALTVHPDYARLGLGTELSPKRSDLREQLNIRFFFAWMTSEGSSKAAEKTGWITEYEIRAEEVAKKLNVTFKSPPPYFKLMLRIF